MHTCLDWEFDFPFFGTQPIKLSARFCFFSPSLHRRVEPPCMIPRKLSKMHLIFCYLHSEKQFSLVIAIQFLCQFSLHSPHISQMPDTWDQLEFPHTATPSHPNAPPVKLSTTRWLCQGSLCTTYDQCQDSHCQPGSK